jgi:hypothetical protein
MMLAGKLAAPAPSLLRRVGVCSLGLATVHPGGVSTADTPQITAKSR